MKRIKLLGIFVENFMCYAQADFNFYDLTKIMAENGKGKSSIFNAYMWCLFNCDVDLRDNPVVRREVDGVSVDDVDTSVKLMLDVDGTAISMKKVQRRTYSKDGSSYKDDNSYFVNDVPKTLKDFNEYLEIDMDAFKMCSNINAFIGKKPADMRDYLFSLVSDVSDSDIASQNAELNALVPLLEKYSAEELSAMNKATKTRITKELPVIDGQIKEKERDIQIKLDMDVSDLELQRNSLKEQIEECVAKQTDNDKLMSEYDNANAEILDLKHKMNDLQTQANEENEKSKEEIKNQMLSKRVEFSNIADEIQKIARQISVYRNSVEEKSKEQETLRDKWNKTNAEVFDENTAICPTCRRELPTEEVERLVSEFDSSKKERLDSIESRGLLLKEEIRNNDEIIADLEKRNNDNLAIKLEIEKEISSLENKLLKLPASVDVSETDEYKEIMAQLYEKEKSIQSATSFSQIKSELKAQENDLRNQFSECERKLSASNTEYDEKRLAELRENKLDFEQSKTDAEHILDLLNELDKAKNNTLSDAINSHFGLVRWKLFELAKNGNYKSICVPMVDGKSILTTMSNKGNRILGRVDICDSIQKISGISCPVWLDDSESLDSENQSKVADMVDSQLIMLIVNDGKKLEIMEG